VPAGRGSFKRQLHQPGFSQLRSHRSKGVYFLENDILFQKVVEVTAVAAVAAESGIPGDGDTLGDTNDTINSAMVSPQNPLFTRLSLAW